MLNKPIVRPNKIIFQYKNTDNEYAHDITLEFTCGDPGLGELHSMCKQFVSTLGYSHKAIEEAFGEDFLDD